MGIDVSKLSKFQSLENFESLIQNLGYLELPSDLGYGEGIDIYQYLSFIPKFAIYQVNDIRKQQIRTHNVRTHYLLYYIKEKGYIGLIRIDIKRYHLGRIFIDVNLMHPQETISIPAVYLLNSIFPEKLPLDFDNINNKILDN